VSMFINVSCSLARLSVTFRVHSSSVILCALKVALSGAPILYPPFVAIGKKRRRKTMIGELRTAFATKKAADITSQCVCVCLC
jgi:hypothetical protein